MPHWLCLLGIVSLIIGGLCAVVILIDNPVFRFMMQIAMIVGFMTAYTVDVWLVKRGMKERM